MMRVALSVLGVAALVLFVWNIAGPAAAEVVIMAEFYSSVQTQPFHFRNIPLAHSEDLSVPVETEVF